MSARAFNWACAQSPKTTSQKLVLLVLADRADEDGFCFPGTEWISKKCAPMPRESARRVLRELAEQGFVVKEKRRRRDDGTLGTWELRLQVDDPKWGLDQWAPMHGGDSGPGGHPCTVEPAGTHARADVGPQRDTNPNGFSTVVDHWLAFAPPLVSHKRKALASDAPTKRLVGKALDAHGLADVKAAIANYATVLASDDHWLVQKWSMHLFFKQRNAFPMFLPEADPLTNYLNRKSTGGRDRGLSFDEIIGGGDEPGTEPRKGLPRAA